MRRTRVLRAFTVLELLVALAMASTMMAAAGLTFHVAADAWSAGAARAYRRLQVTQGLELLADDLSRQVDVSHDEGFVGEPGALAWWGEHESMEGSDRADGGRRLVRYRYVIDNEAQALLREVEPWTWGASEIPDERLAGGVVAEGVFSFPYRSESDGGGDGTIRWLSEWRHPYRPPAAVRIHVEWWEDAQRTRRATLDRVVWLPQGVVGWR